MAIKLYQFAISHFCEKVRWALDYKGLNYEPAYLLPGNHPKLIKSMTSDSSVPVLSHDGTIVQGSAKILDYLDATFPDRPLTPADPETRQLVLEWERRLDKQAGPAVRCFCYHYLLQRPRQVVPLLSAHTPFYNRYLMRLGFSRIEEIMRKWMKINDTTARSAQETMETLLAELQEAYRDSDYLVGNAFSRADLTAAALFAPLFQPSAYPVPWPKSEKLPKPMLNWLAQNEDTITAMAGVYQRHRQA